MSEASRRELGALRNLKNELDDLERALEIRSSEEADAEDEGATATHLVRVRAFSAIGRWISVVGDLHPEMARTYSQVLNDG